jgi:excisionase family DNA binding protein
MTQLPLPFDFGEPGQGPAFLTIAEAAEQLQVCERTVRRAIDAGVLRAARVRGTRAERGCWRIHRDDLARWIYDEPPS